MTDQISTCSLARSQLILGGQKSGKSRRAELLARAWLDGALDREAALIATGQPWDDEMRERSEEHTSELQSPCNLVCRLLLEKKKTDNILRLLFAKNTTKQQTTSSTSTSPCKSYAYCAWTYVDLMYVFSCSCVNSLSNVSIVC